MCAKHELGMIDVPAVHPDGILIGRCRYGLGEVDPAIVGGLISQDTLAEEQEVDDNVGTGIGAEAAFG
uniref:hypothetical protein n=1 Tax=Streptococcus pneumoniae TaxID=1313 RepID=UPI0013D8E775